MPKRKSPLSILARAIRLDATLMDGALRGVLPQNDWGDSAYALWRFRQKQGRFPDPNTSPPRYSDRLFRMKTDGTYLDPLRQFITDKEHVKHYVASIVGWQYAVETYQILHHPHEVDNLKLERFPCVIKPTHLSGPVIFMTGPNQSIDHELVKSWLEDDNYKNTREQNYKYLRPKLIVEEFFSDDGQTIPNDYKILCFDGSPKIIQVDIDRYGQHIQQFYDLSWNRLQFNVGFDDRPDNDPKPAMLEDMLDVATRLAQPFSFIRVDTYTDGKTLKVGELTNCPHSADRKFDPPESELMLGKLFDQS